MKPVPPKVARAIVLRRLPRALRVALDPEVASGPLPAQLASDAAAVSPELGPSVALWIRENVGECPGLARWIGRAEGRRTATVPAGPSEGGLAALDWAAADGDVAVLREIADALVMIGGYDRAAPLAGRAAATAWACLARMVEAGTALHQAGLAGAAVQGGGEYDVPPWPDLDGVESPPGAAEAPDRAAMLVAVELAFDELRLEARLLAIGLSAIAAGRPVRSWAIDTLAQTAIGVAREALDPHVAAAVHRERADGDARARHEIDRLRERVRTAEAALDPIPEQAPDAAAEPAEGYVLVCPRLPATGAGKGKDVSRGYESAIGKPLPLVPTPDLAEARRTLLREFPYAPGMVDAALGAFAVRPHVHAPPLVVVGPPGSGKSRFVRRLGETLGVGVYRIDGANDGGGSFGGTERRWYTSEPCRPFMAIARHGHANPLLCVDEVDKAATRSDYGRLWDAMLQVLDPENAARFPDPSLQVELDLSWVTVACTANSIAVLPAPLLDRMRVVRCPEPGAEHLDALLPGVLAAIAAEAGLDPRFHGPLDGVERAALRSRWRGGSVRRLRRAVEAVLRVRERGLAGRAH